MATSSADKTIKIWAQNSNSEWTATKELKGHGKWVWDCVFSVDSAYLVSGEFEILLCLISRECDHLTWSQPLPIKRRGCGISLKEELSSSTLDILRRLPVWLSLITNLNLTK